MTENRTIREIKINYSIEKTTGKGRGIGEEGDKEGTRGGKNAIGWGNKVHVNGTPVLSDGHVMQGADDANFQATYDRAWDEIPKVNDGYIFVRWAWDGEHGGGPIALGSYADNFGCTPSLKADKDAEDGKRHSLAFYLVYAEGTPQEVKSETITLAVD